MVLSSLFSPNTLKGGLVACLDVHESASCGITFDVVACRGLSLASLLDGTDSVTIA